MAKPVFHLYCIISFLDCFCTGITLPVLNNHIISVLDGSHLLLGLLGVIAILSQAIINFFIAPIMTFIGPKRCLLLVHLVGFFSYSIILFARNYAIFLFFRVPFIFFNQTSTIIDKMLSKEQDKREKEKNTMEKMKSLALILGPFFGGLLYHDNSFLQVVYVLNTLTIVNLLIIWKLPDDIPSKNCQKLPEPSFSEYNNNMKELWMNWSPYNTMKLYVFIGTTCFFVKNTLLLRSLMEAAPSLVGFTLAMHNMILLSAEFAGQMINEKTCAASRIWRLIMLCILCMSCSMYILCTTIDFAMYLCAFVILAMTMEIFERLWSISVRADQKERMESFLSHFTCVVLVVLGIACDFYGHAAVQFMALTPLVVAFVWGLTKMGQSRTKHKVEQQIETSFNLVNINAKKIR